MIKVMEQFEAEKETMASAYSSQMDKLMETRMLWNWKRIWTFA